ncbi:MAG: hypothetical protein M1281_18450 [Chloroflexi bacterium]|nr:hypothetical protein [Chloroflexota bacterium]
MSEGAQDLLVRGIAAAKAGDKSEARFYLNWMLTLEAEPGQQMEAWYWLSEISDEPAQQRRFLEEILAEDPFNFRARRKLSILDGRLDPTQIVDPDHLPPIAIPAPAPGDLQRFTCPQCGGRMTYTPDGTSLTCEYCATRQRDAVAEQAVSGEEDFLLALATQRGHSGAGAQLVDSPALDCPSCGASFWLAPDALSLTCPYCQSVYVIKRQETRRLIPPAAILSMSISRELAHLVLEGLGCSNAILQGLYLPAWSFFVGGQVAWKALRRKNRQWVPEAGLELGDQQDILAPASPRWKTICPEEISGYDLGALVPYEPRYLADWPAETYQIAAAQASLSARQIALKRIRQKIEGSQFEGLRDLTLDSSTLSVETFRLVLLPIWMASSRDGESREYLNGQTGGRFSGD